MSCSTTLFSGQLIPLLNGDTRAMSHTPSALCLAFSTFFRCQVGMEDLIATRPSLVLVLDLPAESQVLKRISGRRVDPATGTLRGDSASIPSDVENAEIPK